MSLRYKGAVISATPPTLVAGAGASGAWTLQQQMQAIASGYWPVNGPFYIEDVFSTYLYTGNGATQTITNGIDLSTYGGLVWSKNRTQVDNNRLYDTARGTNNVLISNSTSAALTDNNTVTAFNSNGYSIGTSGNVNFNGDNFVSWTFRKQPKFFDVVTYTGDGASSKTIAHSLGSTPGCIIVKRTSGTSGWQVFHRSLGNTDAVFLNNTNPTGADVGYWNNTSPTATDFTIGSFINGSGSTYVAYLFAHNAGGFGLSGSDNVISCGSWTNNGSGNASVTLGYEPQWILWKRSDSTSDWYIFDTMRGWTGDPNNSSAGLRPNLSNAENSLSGYAINSTGFSVAGVASATYIYIAIRRGPMKTPTSGTSVFNPNAYTATGVGSRAFSNVGFSPDWSIFFDRSNAVGNSGTNMTKLIGPGVKLQTTNTSAENTGVAAFLLASFDQLGYTFGASTGSSGQLNGANGDTKVFWNFARAPGFFDVVCFTATGSTFSVTHNLGVAPELVITKERNGANAWYTYSATYGYQYYLSLNGINAKAGPTAFFGTGNPTSTTLSLSGGTSFFSSGQNYVAYLFATVAGVSKVGSYTGTGTTKQIDCGFTGGARFVLIKRTDSTGDWYVWDSARGIVAGNDPYLLLNSTAAEVTNTDYVDTYSAGFEISSTAPAAINANGGTFIFLAIA